jgi:divalent metal cation (Fe/Co/Zn/Cd) transporter
MLSDTLSKILGERADAALAVAIKKTIAEYPNVRGAYDLVLHNYGPDSYNGSVHIEVPDTLTANELDKMLRKITVDVLHKHDVLLTAIGVYSNNRDPEIVELREKVREIAKENPYVIQMHAFYIDRVEKTLRFDIVISFDAPDRSLVYQDVLSRTQEAFPGYDIQIATDIDFTEILES